MQLDWYHYIVVYMAAFAPYFGLALLLLSLIRDALLRRVHRATTVLAVITVVLFMLNSLLARVI